MSWFWLILISIPFLDLIWWRWADQQLRPLARARLWRPLLAAFMLLQIAGLAFVIVSRMIWSQPPMLGPWIFGAVFIWHLLILPITTALLAAGSLLAGLAQAGRWAFNLLSGPVNADAVDPPADPPPAGPHPTRRQVLLGAAATLPPLLTAGSLGSAMVSLPGFRIRPLTVNIPGLPLALDGLTIAHISDLHSGAFTPPAKMAAIVDHVNALKPDLVLMTGDLIDFALEDLPAGLEVLLSLRSRYGLFACEGNHDLFESREQFETRVKRSGVPLLLNETETLTINGQPVQIMGLAYGRGRPREPLINYHLARLLPQRRPDAFPILLAHHPHAFDPAADAGIPLTLAGHTHGGQLMLNQFIGAGPMLFRYWSGLYTKPHAALVVSNGVGNWFPLRINAPAEIVHLTLRGSASEE